RPKGRGFLPAEAHAPAPVFRTRIPAANAFGLPAARRVPLRRRGRATLLAESASGRYTSDRPANAGDDRTEIHPSGPCLPHILRPDSKSAVGHAEFGPTVHGGSAGRGGRGPNVSQPLYRPRTCCAQSGQGFCRGGVHARGSGIAAGFSTNDCTSAGPS